LGALLGEYVDEARADVAPTIPLEDIIPNPNQPRKEFSQAALEELASSIKENGLLQPLLVRPHPSQLNKYEVVAGERRLRAVRSLGWDEVPAIKKEVGDDSLLVLALVENIQREDLGVMEEAEGYRVLAEDMGMTHSEIAGVVGKARTTVANALRLLGLPPAIKKYLEAGELTAGHARALLMAESQNKAAALAGRVVREGWSVRRTEKEARAATVATPKNKGSRGKEGLSPVLRAFQEELRVSLEARVKVSVRGRSSGVIEVPFYSEEDFDRVFLLLTGKEAEGVVS
tara:strand:+ start:363 stop:1223 length:861 start_codon:yes stop_codon:yes gene_type:complete